MAATPPPEALQQIRAQSGKKSRRWIILAVVLVLVAGGIFLFVRSRNKGDQLPKFETVKVERGDIRETVIATGTLSPLDAVDVGAEVTGRVVKVHVDINDQVKEGDILAELDPEQLSARVEESQAQLSSARSSYKSAKASVLESELKQKRTKELFNKGLASAQDLETADAGLARAKASVASASSQVTVANAGLKSAKTSMAKAIIRSPINGVVLERSVEPGATVTAGFQTPVLFTLARGLKQLQLEVDVDEADVGKVKDGQPATFEVDAYPKRKFTSKLTKLHNLPKAGSTVVTYLAVLSVDNAELLLRPGMTATATIVTSELKGVLLVPNVALRFQMPAGISGASGGGRGRSFSPIPGFGGPRGAGRGGGARPSGSAAPARSGGPERIPPGSDALYVLRDGQPRRMRVEAGATDGIKTEVKGRRLSEGMEVIVDVASEESK